MYEYSARCERVVDADTLDLLVNVGFDVHIRQRIRLLGIDAPERGTIAGDDATAFTRAWIDQYGPELTLRTVKDRREKFGRYLGTIVAGTRLLNDDLVTHGHAKDYDGGRRTSVRRGQPDPSDPVL